MQSINQKLLFLIFKSRTVGYKRNWKSGLLGSLLQKVTLISRNNRNKTFILNAGQKGPSQTGGMQKNASRFARYHSGIWDKSRTKQLPREVNLHPCCCSTLFAPGKHRQSSFVQGRCKFRKAPHLVHLHFSAETWCCLQFTHHLQTFNDDFPSSRVLSKQLQSLHCSLRKTYATELDGLDWWCQWRRDFPSLFPDWQLNSTVWQRLIVDD
jgi:hypothetical protein